MKKNLKILASSAESQKCPFSLCFCCFSSYDASRRNLPNRNKRTWSFAACFESSRTNFNGLLTLEQKCAESRELLACRSCQTSGKNGRQAKFARKDSKRY